MRYTVLALDYDGTLAKDGVVDAPTLRALRDFKGSGRRLLLVTGREIPDLQHTFPELALFDQVVAENGAVLFNPSAGTEKPLAAAPRPEFVEALRARGVQPLSVGRVIVATWQPREVEVLSVIQTLGLELELIFNKGAVMVLPSGINKGTGLRAALQEFGILENQVVGAGDAENDHSFLNLCAVAVAVGNALPALKDKADIVTHGARGDGVQELIARILENDLADVSPRPGRRSPVGA